MTDLTIGRETFRVRVEGDATKPAVLMSHALGTDLTMWDGQVADLAKHFRVVRYDARGHGGSVTDDAPASIARLGGDVVAILDALEIDTAHFLGLSLGGAVGLWLLANAPERIDRAILANTSPRISSPDAWNARITSIRRDGMRGYADAVMERWFSPAFSAREPDRVGRVHAIVRGTSPEGYAASCAALRDMDLRATLGSIRNEVLVVTGRHDPVVPTEDIAALVAGVPGARHVVLEARHISNIEAQGDFNAAVVAFLTRPARKSAPAPKAKATLRKPPSAKTAPVKRGGASRRSNAARNPLTKVPGKRAPAKAAARGAATKKKAETRRRPASKRTATRRAPPKGIARQPAKTKQPVKKATPRKMAATRRPTPTAAARGAVEKTKPARQRTAKATTKKTAVKSPAKKLPASRRKSTTKPRRPTGRRKT